MRKRIFVLGKPKDNLFMAFLITKPHANSQIRAILAPPFLGMVIWFWLNSLGFLAAKNPGLAEKDWPSINSSEVEQLSDCLRSGEPRACLEELEALGNKAYLEKDSALIINYLYFKASFLNRMNRFEEAIEVQIEAEALGPKHDGLAYFKVLISLGATYFENQNYYKSIDYLIRAEDILDARIPAFDRAVLMNYLGILYYQEGAYQSAWEYFTKALFLMHKNQASIQSARKSSWLQNVLSNIGLCQLRLDRPELALKFFNLAYTEAKANWNTDGMGLAMLNKGRAIHALYPDSTGLYYYEKAYGLLLVNRSPELLANTVSLLMEAQMDLGQLEGAEPYVVMALQSLNNNRSLTSVQSVYSALARYHFLSGAYKPASEYYQKANLLLDSLAQLDSKNLMQLEATRQKLSQERAERKLYEAQTKNTNENYRTTVVFLIIAGAILLVLGVLLNRLYMQQRRTSRLLSTVRRQKEELEQLNAELNLTHVHKNYLLGAVAHDIRNLLGNVNQVSELLLMDFEGEDEQSRRTKHLLHLMSQSGRLGMHTIQDLLEGVRPEREFDLEKEPLLPESLVQEVVGLLSLRAERKQLSIHTHIKFNRSFLGDPDKLKRALLNVMDNAIKFSPSRAEIHLWVEKKGSSLSIKVQDRGIGFNVDSKPNLIQPFSVEGRKGTAGETTTGLGLYIVQKLISAHGGSLSIDNRPDGGAEVKLRIPLGER